MKPTDPVPLTALRVFEAAARIGNFTEAGRELGMTQAAVSYQVKRLERLLGSELFRRTGRRIALSPAGERLGQDATAAFAMLRTACATVASQRPDRIAITALPTVASHWLVPRLASFQRAHPDLSVQIEPSVALADMRRAPFDFAIRTGDGNWPGCSADPLFPDDFDVVCGPDLVKGGVVISPADVLKLPLFGRDSSWAAWALFHGVEGAWQGCPRPTNLGTQPSEVVAALTLNGAVVVTPKFFEDDLSSGRLVRPFPITTDRPTLYWLVYRDGTEDLPHVRAFRRWVRTQL